jgi:hypothetical protein
LGQVKAKWLFLVRRAGFGWSDRQDDAVPTQVVSGCGGCPD